MSCYQRHLTGLFDVLDMTYDKQNRAVVHDALMVVLRLPEGALCPVVWQALKDRYGPIDKGFDALARDVAAVLSLDD